MGADQLRITGLDVWLCGTSWRNLTLVKVSTDSGIVGWGDATVEYREYAVARHLDFLHHLVVGVDALAPARVWRTIVEHDFMTGDAVGLASASAIINACLDIAGKAMDVPVHRLLGGALRDRIPIYANGWYQGERTVGSFAALARTVIDRGHRALKLDPFGAAGMLASAQDIDDSVELVGAVRDVVGTETTIYVDAHGRLAPAMARRAIAGLAEHRVAFIEEPVAPHDLRALADLRAGSPIPIAAGERCIGRTGFRPLIEGDCVDVVQPDVSWAGGLLEVQRIAAWAELHGMVVALHNANSALATMTACHLAAVLPNILVLETFDDFDEPWVREALPGLPATADGHLPLPDRPGIGIEPNEDALAEHPARPVFMNINEPGWEHRDSLVGRTSG
jgi:galactonate dehydratase